MTNSSITTPESRLTRRNVLAAGAGLGVVGLAGCINGVDELLGRAAEAGVTTTVATPAAFYGGSSRPERCLWEREYSVDEHPITVSGEVAGTDTSVELDSYFTRSTVRAQNHNSSRSNVRGISWWLDPDDDGDGLPTVLELERELAHVVEKCLRAVSRRSESDATAALDSFIDITTDALRPELDSCGTDVCKTVRQHSDGRVKKIQTAMEAVNGGEWERAETELHGVRDIVTSDIDLLEEAIHERRPPEVDELYAYLDGDAVVGERFVLTVPDAESRASDDGLVDELTPARLLETVADSEIPHKSAACDGCVYAWGGAPRLSSEIGFPFPVGTTGPYNPNEQLLALGYNGNPNNATVLVPSKAPSDTDDDDTGAGHGGFYTSDGAVTRFKWSELETWGEEVRVGDTRVTPTIVGSITAHPPDCPAPMPALCYIRRIRHDGQYLFVGGWTIDDHALYDNAVTMLVAEDRPELVAIDHDENADVMRRAITSGLRRERSALGSLTYDGEFDDEMLTFLPPRHSEGERRELLLEGARTAISGRNPQTGKELKIALQDGRVGADEQSLQATVVSLDCPVVHIGVPAGCPSCSTNPDCNCTTNLVPAVNNISSR